MFHKGVFLAEIFHLVREPGDFYAELHGKQDEEDKGKKEKRRCRCGCTYNKGKRNKPLVFEN